MCPRMSSSNLQSSQSRQSPSSHTHPTPPPKEREPSGCPLPSALRLYHSEPLQTLGPPSHGIPNVTSPALQSLRSRLKELRLELGIPIGGGNFANVYASTWEENGQLVAVKQMFESEQDADLLEEILLHSTLRHRNIILFLGAGLIHGRIVLVTDIAENGSLKRVITEDRGSGCILDWKIKIRIWKGIASGLVYLHSKDIIHRDLKSANILLTEHLEVRICDFGLAIRKAATGTTGWSGTEAGVGTLRWKAPELLRGTPKYSPESDIYSLGMIMWELATNCTAPFSWLENSQVADYVLSGNREVIPNDIPDEFVHWIKRCWKSDPAKRPKACEMVQLRPDKYASLVMDGVSELSGTDLSTCKNIEDSASGKSKRDSFSVTTTDSKASISMPLACDPPPRDDEKPTSPMQTTLPGLISHSMCPPARPPRSPLRPSPINASSSHAATGSELSPVAPPLPPLQSSSTVSNRLCATQHLSSHHTVPLVSSPVNLIRRIGSGGYCNVYLAVLYGRMCAVKMSSEVHNVDLLREIKILSSLRHQNIIQYLGTTFADHRPAMLTCFAEHGSLRRIITAHVRSSSLLDWPTKIRIANEIAHALQYLHTTGIIHRDIKSDNVLLTKHLEVKLGDFGLAMYKSTANTDDHASMKQVVGTLRWMAPELLRATPMYSTASDMYVYGMVMWEMAANCTHPFQNLNANRAVMDHVLSGGRETIPEDTPAVYRQRIEQCWYQDPAIRPQASESVQVIADTLESLVTDDNCVVDNSRLSVMEDYGWRFAGQESMHHASPTEISMVSLTPSVDTAGVSSHSQLAPDSTSQGDGLEPCLANEIKAGKTSRAQKARRWASGKVSDYLLRLSGRVHRPHP